MSNVYSQVVGTKRMVLFPPSDVPHLHFAPGSSSSSLDVFQSLPSNQKASPANSTLSRTHPHEALLGPGDMLLIPATWLHTATPTSDMSIAVNVFFRDLEEGKYATGRDVYGNRDLAAYEKGRADVAKLVRGFERVPEEVRKFYLMRLADEMLQACGGGH
jgi:tRNA wybutosine-synthesizing protein 4